MHQATRLSRANSPAPASAGGRSAPVRRAAIINPPATAISNRPATRARADEVPTLAEVRGSIDGTPNRCQLSPGVLESGDGRGMLRWGPRPPARPGPAQGRPAP